MGLTSVMVIDSCFAVACPMHNDVRPRQPFHTHTKLLAGANFPLFSPRKDLVGIKSCSRHSASPIPLCVVQSSCRSRFCSIIALATTSHLSTQPNANNDCDPLIARRRYTLRSEPTYTDAGQLGIFPFLVDIDSTTNKWIYVLQTAGRPRTGLKGLLASFVFCSTSLAYIIYLLASKIHPVFLIPPQSIPPSRITIR